MEEQRGKQIAEGRSDNLAASPAVILPADREDFTPRWLLECVIFFHISYSDLSFCRVPAQVVGFFCEAININAPPRLYGKNGIFPVILAPYTSSLSAPPSQSFKRELNHNNAECPISFCSI